MTAPEARLPDALRAAGWVCTMLAGIGVLVALMLTAGLLAAQASQVSLANESAAWTDTATLLVCALAVGGVAAGMFAASDRMLDN